MIHNYRHFEVVDPFDRIWQVEFRWQQTGISIRHADTVDVKWQLTSPDQTQEKVVALPHSLLLLTAKKLDRQVSDPWCMKIAAAHLMKMLETWQDMDKTLVTLGAEELEEAAQTVARWEAAKLEEKQLA
jgi:hypothetical protein